MEGADHDHRKYVSQCEEGCECNLLFIRCYDCDLWETVDGWNGCNVDWTYWVLSESDEDTQHIKAKAKEIQDSYAN